MNYLGHLYFSNNDPDLMLANLYGDFVKGKNQSHYHPTIQTGIQLHRQIDTFMDSHFAVTELRKSLFSKLPKVAGIAIDLYFDHLLAMNWMEHHDEDLISYLERFYLHEASWEHELNPHFTEFLVYFRSNKWLNHYASDFGLRKLCQGVSSKLSFPNRLMDAPQIYYEHQEVIKESFTAYMIDAKKEFGLY